MQQQSALMKFDPANGGDRPYPSHAAQWRDWHGHSTAWLFNPWTGERRDARNVGSDVAGHLIIPPGDPIRLARSLSDDLMDCVDRLGSEAETVDPRVWGHLRVYAPKEKLGSDVTDVMVGRFLSWTLPRDFSPDGHIRFDRDAADAGSWPVGTNLLNAIQARAMLKHVLGIAPAPGLPADAPEQIVS